MLRAKAAGNHGRPIFLANCDTEPGYVPYVGRYVGIVRNSKKKYSRITIGVNLVSTYWSGLTA
jgi:hypothetical protein